MKWRRALRRGLRIISQPVELEETLNKTLHALAGSFSVMRRQIALDVAMLRLRTIFLA